MINLYMQQLQRETPNPSACEATERQPLSKSILLKPLVSKVYDIDVRAIQKRIAHQTRFDLPKRQGVFFLCASEGKKATKEGDLPRLATRDGADLVADPGHLGLQRQSFR